MQEKNSSSCSKFYISNKCITNKQDIADGFNSYFANIEPSLADRIPASTASPIDTMKDKITDSMFIQPVIESEVQTLIKQLNLSSPGYDSDSATVVKAAESSFILSLTHVLNISLSSGVFPTEMKIARVIPLLKTGDPMKLSNYRPVSVLPLFSKLFERLMYNRLISFVNKHEVLYSLQFGFRHGYSTSLAMIYLVEKNSQSLDNGDYVLGLYLDFTKAFDTVNHAILLQKLEHYGVRGVALNWFKSYLSGRTQFVDYQGVRSTTCYITCGVPQGSILDSSHVSSILFGLLFADDSTMFMSVKNPDELIHTTNKEMEKIVNWLEINKLTLNISKTHYMLFRNSHKKAHLTLKLVIRGQKVEMVESTKFLGVYLDSRLAWRNHIDYIKG